MGFSLVAPNLVRARGAGRGKSYHFHENLPRGRRRPEALKHRKRVDVAVVVFRVELAKAGLDKASAVIRRRHRAGGGGR